MRMKKGYVVIDQKVYILDFHTKIYKKYLYPRFRHIMKETRQNVENRQTFDFNCKK